MLELLEMIVINQTLLQLIEYSRQPHALSLATVLTPLFEAQKDFGENLQNLEDLNISNDVYQSMMSRFCIFHSHVYILH
jgi:hypothetical protein